MKFLLTYMKDPSVPPPTPEKMAEIGKFAEDNFKSGVLVMTGGIRRATKGTKVRQAGGKFAVTDGPFPETKELIDGYAIVNVPNEKAAIEQAASFMKVAGDGEGEILRIYDPTDPMQ